MLLTFGGALGIKSGVAAGQIQTRRGDAAPAPPVSPTNTWANPSGGNGRGASWRQSITVSLGTSPMRFSQDAASAPERSPTARILPFPLLFKLAPQPAAPARVVPYYSTPPVATAFPNQFSWLRMYFHGAVQTLCVVATADAPAGNQLRIANAGLSYAIYLVDTTDPNASPARINTSTGIKAIRLKT